MKVAPIVAIHIPFGGDNHRDVGLATETAQTISGVATIAALMQQLAAAGLSDSVDPGVITSQITAGRVIASAFV